MKMKSKFIYVSSYDETIKETGINKKIYYQYKAIKSSLPNNDVYLSTLNFLEGKREIGIYNTKYKIEYKNKIDFKLNRWKFIEKIIKLKNIDIIYIRYEHFSSPNFVQFLKNIQTKKIILEIPTYPYDNEYNQASITTKINHFMDKLYRKKLYKYVDKIVTFSLDKEIWNIPCINISNGINLDTIKLIEKKEIKLTKKIRLTAVSSCLFWHGIDRMLLSLEEYRKKNTEQEIIFNIVGDGPELEKLKKIVLESQYLSNTIRFQGFKKGEELNKIYNETDIAVGSLGRHRSGLHVMRALKNREYCAKGLPMIFSEDDPDLKEVPFVYHASADEQLINIEELIEWYKGLSLEPNEIRKYSEKFSWSIQMKKVLDEIKKI